MDIDDDYGLAPQNRPGSSRKAKRMRNGAVHRSMVLAAAEALVDEEAVAKKRVNLKLEFSREMPSIQAGLVHPDIALPGHDDSSSVRFDL